MRKYLFSASVIGALVSTFSVVKETREGPRNWQLGLSWATWALSLVTAIVTVREKSMQHKNSHQ